MAERDMKALLAQWIDNVDDAELSNELESLERGGEAAVADAFFQDLAFGTAGLRGVIGAGTNRMNVFTVARATQGLADYLNEHYDAPSVAIARDSRIKGELFVRTAASVLAANGVKSFIYPRVEPTPALSFAVRELGCSAGINMTASHNPAAYNGYKVYGADGCQITSEAAREISERIGRLAYFEGEGPCAKTMPYEDAVEAGLIGQIGDEVLKRFIDAVAEQSLGGVAEKAADGDAVGRGSAGDAARRGPAGGTARALSVVYTPLNGTGLECVSAALERIGVTDVKVVPEQAQPDGAFPTCTYPNPEERAALERGIALCDRLSKEGSPADLLLATDPDADRVGIACKDGDGYSLVSGNEMGVLLLDYVARQRAARSEDLSRAVAVTTIVSSAMVDLLAKDHSFELRRTLTGFKYIGEQIGLLEAAGEADRFIFGFEESYGYLAGTHVRDKDAVVASMLICELACECRARGTNLVGAMRELYERYGWCLNRTISLSYPGADGSATMDRLMAQLRTDAPREVAGRAVERVIDYGDGVAMPVVGGEAADEAKQTLPAANVIEFDLAGDCKLIIRPSGTEPKIKAYLFSRAESRPTAEALLDELEAAARSLLA